VFPDQLRQGLWIPDSRFAASGTTHVGFSATYQSSFDVMRDPIGWGHPTTLRNMHELGRRGPAVRLNQACRYRRPLAVAAAFLIGFSTLPQSSSRHRPAPPANVYGPQSSAPAGGGYSADPRTRELEILADKYRPRGW
jgi:hypothetical protein